MPTVREATFELFRSHGMTTFFGNPGSTELPLLAEFPEDFTYVLGLQELVVVGMADGDDQATGRPTHVNLHTAPGVGNAVGGIFNAQANKSPLVITAGQQVRAQILIEANLTNRDATVDPPPYVKWSHEPARPQRVARKFEIKNTTGYRLCAFLDADTPLEIFRRLVIGSEGTLAFVAEAVFDTVPFDRHASTGLILFADVGVAADAVGALVAAGATATELMVARTLIAAAYSIPGTPERWKELPPESAALLVEFRRGDPAELDGPERRATDVS